jgi:hypothetical protein
MSSVVVDRYTTTEDWWASSYEALNTITNQLVYVYPNTNTVIGTAEDTEPAAGVGNTGFVRQDSAPRSESVNYGISSQGTTSFSRYQFAYRRYLTQGVNNFTGGVVVYQPGVITVGSENFSSPTLTSLNNVPSTKCRAVITGRYRINASAFAGTTNGNFPHLVPLYIWYHDNTGTKYLLQENITITGQTINIDLAPSANNNIAAVAPTYANGGTNIPEVSFTVRGNSTAAGALNELIYLKLDVDAAKPSTTAGGADGSNYNPDNPSNNADADGWRGTTLRWRPIDNPLGETLDKPFFYGTITRTWEGKNIIIDGVGGDSASFAPVTSAATFAGLIVHPGSAAVEVTSSLSAAITVFAAASIESSCALSATANTRHDSNLATQSNFAVDSFFGIITQGASNISATTELSSITALKLDSIKTLSTSSSQTTTGHLILDIGRDYTWETTTPELVLADYRWEERTEWDAWATEQWGEELQTWDQWEADTWDRGFTLNTTSLTTTSTSFRHGSVKTLGATFGLDNLPAFRKAGAASLASTTNAEFTSRGLIGILFFIFDIEASVSTDPVLRYNGSATLANAFTATLTANIGSSALAVITVVSTLEITPTFKPGMVPTTYVVTATQALSPTFKPAGFADLLALASTLSTIRMFFQADPFNIIKVDPQTNRISIAIENRQVKIDGENRVNIVSAETRDYIIPQETRILKLMKAPFLDRFTTPRVRSEA